MLSTGTWRPVTCRKSAICIAAYITTPSDREAVQDVGAGSASVQFCSTPQQLSALLNSAQANAAVVEAPAVLGPESIALAAAISQRSFPTVVRVPLSGGVIREVVRWSEHVYDLRLSVRRAEPMGLCVRDILAARIAMGSRILVLSRLIPFMDDAAIEIVTAALVIGSQGGSVHQLARVCACPVRTLEARLDNAKLPSPKRLLMLMFALHVTWLVVQERYTAKRVAFESGFSSVRALSARLRRAIGGGVMDNRDVTTFSTLLESLVAAVGRSRGEDRFWNSLRETHPNRGYAYRHCQWVAPPESTECG
jgi:hypothetical protein